MLFLKLLWYTVFKMSDYCFSKQIKFIYNFCLLSSTVQGLQGRVESLEKSNSKLIEEVLLDFRKISLICGIEILNTNFF